MGMFSQNELLLMIGVVSVLLVCITILTILDIREYLKNKNNCFLEEELEEFEPRVEKVEVQNNLVEEKPKEETIEVFEEKEEVLVNTMQEEVLRPTFSSEELEPVEIVNEIQEQPIEIFEEVPNDEPLSIQVNEAKDNINLQEELEKATDVPSLEDTITNFEMEQERTAIISLDELLNKSNELYDANEVMQYDDGNEPITIDEVMNRFNDNKVAEKQVPEVMANIVTETEEPKKELYSHKESIPFISSVYGLEPNDHALAFENTATYEKLDRSQNSEFMNKLREMSENKLNH